MMAHFREAESPALAVAMGVGAGGRRSGTDGTWILLGEGKDRWESQ